MQGLRFSKYKGKNQSTFDRLLEVFKELLLHTSGEVDEAIDWLRALDQEYQLSTKEYTIDSHA